MRSKNQGRYTPPYETLSDLAMGSLGVIIILVVVIIMISSSSQTSETFDKIKQDNNTYRSTLTIAQSNLTKYQNSNYLIIELGRLHKEYEESEQTLINQISQLEFKEKQLKKEQKRFEDMTALSDLFEKEEEYYSKLQKELMARQNELKYNTNRFTGSSFDAGGTAHLEYGTYTNEYTNPRTMKVLIGDKGIFSVEQFKAIVYAIVSHHDDEEYDNFFYSWEDNNSELSQLSQDRYKSQSGTYSHITSTFMTGTAKLRRKPGF